jgi:hypothetical protein
MSWYIDDAEELRHVPAEAPGGRDEALAVLREELRVHAGLVVEALAVGTGGELHEIAVPDITLGEDRHVIPAVVAPGRPVEPATGRQVRLDADDRLDPDVAGRRREVDDPVHDSVVGDRHRGLPIVADRGDEVGHPRRTIEHRELGVDVEMGEAVSQPGTSIVESHACKHARAPSAPRRRRHPNRSGLPERAGRSPARPRGSCVPIR